MSEQTTGEMEVRQKDELESSEGTREGTYFRPPVDIYETDDAITVMADAPGCDPDDFEINLEDSRLAILAATEEL
ncbi:MAG: Hsp20/alpha crystallin family protein, partial [Bradymonadaceae bacterium]